MNLDLLVNKGVGFLNQPSEQHPQKTIVIVGVARGGTSIVAGALHHLGLFLGDEVRAPVFEDIRLSIAFENRSKEAFSEVISDYNQRYMIWGWKRPSSLNHLPYVAESIRNPYFIFLFKDIFSIANRNAISMKMGIKVGLQQAIDGYSKIVQFIAETAHPALLVSSDKVIRHREVLIDALCQFASIKASSKQRDEALAFISPDRVQYLNPTRITKAHGGINKDLLQTGLLHGWARAAYHTNPVEVEVRVNDELIATINADIFREAFKKPNIHPTGKCGYELDLKPLGVQPSSKISVRVKDDVEDLPGSPSTFPKLTRWLSMEEWRASKARLIQQDK